MATRVFLKDVRPDLRYRVLGVTDEEFDAIPANSKDAFTFVCSVGHTVEARPRDYRLVTECRYCSGAYIWPGFNDLATLYPAFLSHWWWENEIDPSTIGIGYNDPVRLVCDQGHVETATLATRMRVWLDTGVFSCRQCRMRNGAAFAKNLLSNEDPALLAQWHPDNDHAPSELTSRSGYLARWVCALEHEWPERVCVRVSVGTGCPYCTGHRVLAGFNDLATVNPPLAAEWHPDNTLRPTEVTAGSNVRVRWRCAEDHEWSAVINNRSQGRGCPRCARCSVSLVERLLWERLARLGHDIETDVLLSDAVWGRRKTGARCDAVIRDARLVLEYDGEYWHSLPERFDLDAAKTQALIEAGWTVLRIREGSLPSLSLDTAELIELTAPTWRIPTTDALAGLDDLAQRVSVEIERHVVCTA